MTSGLRPRNEAPRVVHLVPIDGLGGVETAARSAAAHDFAGGDFRLVFFAGATIARNKQRISDSPGRSLRNPLTYVAGIRTVLALRPDVLICSLWRSLIVGLIVKLLRPQTRLVCFFHAPSAVNAADRWLHALGLSCADEAWADSEATLEARTRGRAIAKRVISFVIEPTAESPDPKSSPRFISWGRLHRHKGHDRALDLIAKLVALGVDARFDLWGPDDGERAKLAALASQLGIANRVMFRGPIDRGALGAAAAGHSLFLQLSRMEGMAMSLIEAMQLGLVPVVTAVGEIPQYVRDGENGLIVNPAEVDLAASRIARLLRTPGAIEAMAARAAETWTGAELYRESFRKAALDLAGKPLRRPSTTPSARRSADR